MIKQASLKTKLMGAFLLIACFSLIVGGISFYSSSQTQKSYAHIASVNLPNSAYLADMRGAALGTARNATMLTNYSISPEMRKKYEERMTNRLQQFAAANDVYMKVPFVEGEAELHEAVMKIWTEVEKHAKEIMTLSHSLDAASREHAQKILIGDFEQDMDQLTQAIVTLRDFQMQQAKLATEKATKNAATGTMMMTGAIVIGFALAFFIGLLLSNALTRRFTALAEQLLQGANQVAAASQQISSASEQLSSSVTEQASSLQETSSSIEEINAMVLKNTENAERSRSSSEASRTTAESGQQAVERVIESIREISESNTQMAAQVEASNKQIADIVKVIAEIGDKTRVINDIVFQTKLLSFNASVEAARAGEHGKGFAVVAEEVGNLAQMSGNAAKEISQMLEGRVQMVESIVRDSQTQMERLMNSSREKIELSNRVAEQCGQVLSEVVGQVTEVSLMASEISTASTEQSQGIQEVTKAVSQLDQATQQNASAANQTSSAATEMSDQAAQLREMVSDLMLIIAGEKNVSTGKRNFAETHKPHSKIRASLHANVVPLKHNAKPAKTTFTKEESPTMKAAAGDDIPSDNDPRFKDI